MDYSKIEHKTVPPTYKAEIRVPTDQFAYFSVWIEDTPQGIVAAHEELKTLYRASQGVGEGLSIKDFNAAVDEFNATGQLKNGPDLYAQMNKEQQFYFQTQKKCIKRLNARGINIEE